MDKPLSTLLQILQSAGRSECVAAMQRISASSTATMDELDGLAACLGSGDKLIQRRAAEALAQIHAAGGRVDELLLTALRSGDAGQRWGAAFALSLIGPLPIEARPVLVETMGLGDGDVRWAAADILLRTPGWDTGPEELRALLLDGNANQRKMAAYCLRRLEQRSAPAQAALTTTLGDVESGVRLAALAALSRLAVDHGAAADAIALLVEDRDAGVRRAAAAALGELSEVFPAASAALHSAALGDDESLRRAATRSLERLRNRAESRKK